MTFFVTETSLEDGKHVTFRRLYIRFFVKAFEFLNYKSFVHHIPIGFTKANNLTKKREITMVDKNKK